MKEQLKHVVVIDIETVPLVADYKELSERHQKQWDKKASFLNNDDNETSEELFNSRGGIYAEFGKVVAISLSVFYTNENGEWALRAKGLADHDEKGLLQRFIDTVEKLDQSKIILCAHNGKEFDFPYLCRRMLVNGLKIPNCLQISGKKPWEIRHVDTLELWKFGDRKSFTSLELLATIFEIPSSKSDIDGSEVADTYYKEDGLERISTYCTKDIIVTAQLFLRLNGFELIKEENIEIVDS